MNATTAQPFALSLAVHVVFGAALVALFVHPATELSFPRPAAAFTLVTDASNEQRSVSESSASKPLFHAPAIPQRPFVPATSSVSATESIAPKPAPKTTSPRMTFQEFQQQHPTSHARGPVVRPTSIQHFATSGFPRPTSTSTNSNGASAVTQGEPNPDFIARLQSELQSSFTGHDVAFDGLIAQVEFILTADGSLRNGQIIRSSGSADYDRAVLEAIRRARLAGFPLELAGQSFRIHFRASEQK